MDKEQPKTEKDGRLEAGSSWRCRKGLGLEHVDLAGLGCWAKGQSSSEGCVCVSACAHMQRVGKEATGWADTTEEGSRKLKLTGPAFLFSTKP